MTDSAWGSDPLDDAPLENAWGTGDVDDVVTTGAGQAVQVVVDPDAPKSSMTRPVILPHTGEKLDLATLEPDDLARLVQGLRDVKSDIDKAIREISDYALSLMTATNGTQLTGESYAVVRVAAKVERRWDVPVLVAGLNRCVAAGLITQEAMDAALIPQDPKPVTRLLDRMAKSGNADVAVAVRAGVLESLEKSPATVKIDRA